MNDLIIFFLLKRKMNEEKSDSHSITEETNSTMNAPSNDSGINFH